MLAINICWVFVWGIVTYSPVHLIKLSQFIETENTTVSQCISDMVRSSLPCRGHLSFVKKEINIETNELIKEIQKVQCHQILVRTFISNDWYIIPENYIILVNNVVELKEGIQKLQYDIFWNPRANIIIQLKYATVNQLPIIFKFLGKSNIFKVLVLINEENGENVYTFRLLNDNLCRRNFDEIKHLGRCVAGAITTKVFEQRKFILENCTIYQAYNDNEKPLNYISEIERYMSSLITEKENITIVYQPRREALNVIYENRSANGAFQALLTRKADIASGGLVLLPSRAEIFDIVWGYFYEQFSVFTPAKQILASDKFFRGFSNTTWLLIAVTIVGVLTFCNILYYKSRNPNHLNLKLYGYVLGQANTRLGDERILRHFLIWWILFTFCICSFYNTALYSLLTSYVQKKTTVDIKDLDNLGLKPCVPPVIYLFYRYHRNIFMDGNLNSSDCQVISSALDRVAFTKDVYTVYFAYGFRFKMRDLFDEFDNSLVEPHDTGITTTSLYFNRGSPYVRIYQKYARWMYEFGFSFYKAEELLGFNNYKIKSHLVIYRPLSLRDMRFAFLILIIGVIASLVYFWHERNNL